MGATEIKYWILPHSFINYEQQTKINLLFLWSFLHDKSHFTSPVLSCITLTFTGSILKRETNF